MTCREEDSNLSFQSPHSDRMLEARATTVTNANGAGFHSTRLMTVAMTTTLSTVTVDTTLVRTTFVTVTTHSTLSGITSLRTAHDSRNELTSTSLIANAGSSRTATSATSSQTAPNGSTPTSSPEIGERSNLSSQQKKAIVASLSSIIAGLIIVGILVVLLLWRRQRRTAESVHGSERGLRHSISRNWSQATSNRTIPNPTPPMSRQSSAADFNGSVIRISLGGFERPFAHHQSFRESMGPRRLMVMNPDDASDFNTPIRKSIESGSTYFKRQRSAVAAAFLGGTRSRASSVAPSHHRGQSIPAISIDPAASSEALPRSQPAPSFRSHASGTSTRTIQQHPPEDPFLTPPDERMEQVAESSSSPASRLQRPSLAVLHTAASSASRTLSGLSQALNAFRPNSSAADDDPQDDGTVSRHSATTFSSNGDPFKLDTRSIMDSSSGIMPPTKSPQRVPRAHISPSGLYEGT